MRWHLKPSFSCTALLVPTFGKTPAYKATLQFPMFGTGFALTFYFYRDILRPTSTRLNKKKVNKYFVFRLWYFMASPVVSLTCTVGWLWSRKTYIIISTVVDEAAKSFSRSSAKTEKFCLLFNREEEILFFRKTNKGGRIPAAMMTLWRK